MIDKSVHVLDPVPTNCPPGNRVESFDSAFAPGVGFSGLRVWVVGFSGPEATLHLSGSIPTSAGRPYKLILAAAIDVTQPITLSAASMDDAGVKWSDTGIAASATSAITFDPSTMASSRGWRNWPLYIYLASAGCYFLHVDSGPTTTGSFFAAGI